MKTIFSPLAEQQTVRVNNINARVSVRVRKCADGVQTQDVMVDGGECGQIAGKPSADDTLQLCKARARLGVSERVLKESQSGHRLFTG